MAESSPTCFSLGIASGEPTHQSVVLWTRLTGDELPPRVEVQWELASDEAFSRIVAKGNDWAESTWGHSIHIEVDQLKPAQPYWYRFHALGQQSATGLTRTTPTPDSPAKLRFIVASCQRWDHGHFAAWRHAVTTQPDLVLFLGDYIYEGASPPDRLRLHEGGHTRTLEQYRNRYAQYKSDPALQAAHAMAPWLVIWDDHEVENDYAGLQGQFLQKGFAEQRAAAYQAYWENMPLPLSMRPDLNPRGASMRIYRYLDWGRLARIQLLDTRQYRDPQACPRIGKGGTNTVTLADCPDLTKDDRSFLGREQERWLYDNWKSASNVKRPWNLMAQQTLMSRWSWTDPSTGSAGTYWTDGWDGYMAGRQRLLQGLKDSKVQGAIVLGGDIHAHYVSNLHLNFDEPHKPAIATEFCGTSIASQGMSNLRVQAAMPYNPHVQYSRSDRRGYMSFELDAQSLKAKLWGVKNARNPHSKTEELAEFIVEAGKPGAITN
jgi:alkaline phosphatase D